MGYAKMQKFPAYTSPYWVGSMGWCGEVGRAGLTGRGCQGQETESSVGPEATGNVSISHRVWAEASRNN